MAKPKTKIKIYSYILLTVYILTSIVFIGSANAANLFSAALTLSNPTPASSGVTYSLSADGFSTGTAIRCVEIRLNSSADGSGAVPTGIVTTSSSLDSSTDVISDSSWTVDNSSNGMLRATYATGENPATSGILAWSGIQNGNTEDTYFGIINTYTNQDCSTGPTDTVTVAFAYINGQDVELTVGPTLTFACAGVASAQNVNGSTTTHASSCTGIDYGNTVTPTTNGVVALDLSVNTNADNGYSIYVRSSGPQTNQSSGTIANHSGTNAVPTAFPSPGTEAWGYTTEDSNLSGGTANRFTSGSGYAGFTTTNSPIVDSETAATTTQTTRVGHQIGLSSATAAGAYRSTVIYTLVASY
jgi:hypothetical protein